MLNRYHAFGWHLLVSLCVAAVSASLVFLVWYPNDLAYASGVTDIFRLLLLVDVILGPVITLIIFDKKKKELKRDLAVVVVMQFVAMLYGLHAVYVARPVYLVFNIDRFDLVYANDFSDQDLAKATKNEYKSLPQFGPKIIAARMPEDVKSRNEILFGSLSGGSDLSRMPQYYVPYPEQKVEVIHAIQSLDKLRKINEESLSAIDALEKKYAATKTKIGYLPLRGKANDLTVIVNQVTGEIIEMSVLKPWL